MPNIRALCACLLTAVVARSTQAQYNVPAARLTQTLRIDGASEDLTMIGWVFIAPDGRIGITQPQDMKALLYSADGKRLATFGQRGSGPGEFRSVAIAGWTGDKIWISDDFLRRVSIFSADGKHELTRSLNKVQVSASLGLPAGSGAFTPVALASDSTMIAYRSAPSRDNPPMIHVRVNQRDEIDRIVVQHPQDDASFSFSAPSGRNFYSMLPFSRTYGELMGADGRRAGYVETRIKAGSGTMRVLVLSATGDTLVSRSESFTPTRVTQAEKDGYLAMHRKGWSNSSNPPPASELDAMDAAMRSRMPDFHSPLISSLMGIDNTIWIGLRVDANATRWVMLNDRGVPELSVVLPPRARIVQASRTTVWAAEYDADDLPSVVRYRIDR